MTQTDTIDWTRFDNGINDDALIAEFEAALRTIAGMVDVTTTGRTIDRFSLESYNASSKYYEFRFSANEDGDTTTIVVRLSDHAEAWPPRRPDIDAQWSVDPYGLRMAVVAERLAVLASAHAAFEAAVWGA
jgi:hypothetical protein